MAIGLTRGGLVPGLVLEPGDLVAGAITSPSVGKNYEITRVKSCIGPDVFKAEFAPRFTPFKLPFLSFGVETTIFERFKYTVPLFPPER